MGKISTTTLVDSPQGTDRLPVGRPGNTSARTVSLDQIKSFAAADSSLVHKAGTEVVTGTKTFSTIPITPNDIRFWLDGQSGRPTLSAWLADPNGTDVISALQSLVDNLADAGNHTVNLYDQVIYLSTPLQLRPGISLVGGTVKGSIYVGKDAVAMQYPLNMRNPRIENVHFLQDSLADGSYAIKYQMAQFAGDVRGCTFDNYDKALWVPQVTVTIPDQIVHRFTVEDCKFNNCNYFVKTERPTTTNFGCADVHFVNCEGRANITNFRLEGVDGFTIVAATLFMNGHGALDQIKEYNIYADMVTWGVIDGVKCFEAGLEGIYIKRFQHVTISGGSVTWSGQRALASAIRLETGDPYGGGRYSSSAVVGVTIDNPSLSGITADSMMGRLLIANNVVDRAGSSTYYYGTADINGVAHYGIDVDPEAKNIVITNNLTPNNVNRLPYNNLASDSYNFSGFNLDSTGYAIAAPNTVTLSGAETDITTTGAKGITQVNLNQPAPATLNISPTGADGAYLFLVAYTGNTTVQDTSNVRLRNRVTVTIPAGGNITLRWISDHWREVGRNFPDAISTSTPTAISGLLKGAGSNIAAAVSGTDYAPATTGTSVLKGNGAGGTTAATAGTDFVAPSVNNLGSTNGTIALSMAYTGVAITPTAGVTFNATGGVAGAMAAFSITADSTTSHTVTFGTNFVSQGSLATGTTAFKKFGVIFFCPDGTKWVEMGRTAAM